VASDEGNRPPEMLGRYTQPNTPALTKTAITRPLMRSLLKFSLPLLSVLVRYVNSKYIVTSEQMFVKQKSGWDKEKAPTATMGAFWS
jgi:hypothetical protein